MLESIISFVITIIVAPIISTLIYLLGVCIVLALAKSDEKGEKNKDEKI